MGEEVVTSGTEYLRSLAAKAQADLDEEHQYACHAGYCFVPTCPYYEQ